MHATDDAFPHGPFLVSRTGGRLVPQDAARLPRLSFAWRGRACEMQVAASGLGFAAIAGHVPFTIEIGPARGELMEVISRMPETLPEGWKLSLTADSRLRLEASTPSEATAVTLLREMVRFALALDPYLDELERAGAG